MAGVPSFSQNIVHLGDTGSGQKAKLFNNGLLMMNQAAIAEIVELAQRVGVNPNVLVEALQFGSAISSALTLLNTMVTPDTVEHLSKVEAEDMAIFATTMSDAGVDAGSATDCGLEGAEGLPALIRHLNPAADPRPTPCRLHGRRWTLHAGRWTGWSGPRR